ncbi:MAG TPA: hypothetical protein VGN16_08955 [Acidobacteriaceae bacterium]|jgi:hypothetical protein
MWAACWVATVVGVVGFAVGLYSYVTPEVLCLLLVIVFLAAQILILVATSIVGFTKWRKSSGLWPAPALICLVFLLGTHYFAPPLGRSISDARFRRHFAQYSSVAKSVTDGSLSCPRWCHEPDVTVPGVKLPKGIVEVGTTACDQGGVLIVFLNRSDVPLVHTGYLLKGYGGNVLCKDGEREPEKQWYMRHLTGSWYRFSDQPGL